MQLSYCQCCRYYKSNGSISYIPKVKSFYRIKQCNFFLLVCLFVFADSSKDERYKVARRGVYSPYVLTITNVSREDTGNYYCCLSSGCSADIEKCQKFTLAVTGKVYSKNNVRNCFKVISCTKRG